MSDQNTDLTIFESGSISASFDSADFANRVFRGVQVVVDVTDVNKDNEVQQIAVDATGGTFTITYSGQTTSAIAFNAAASAVQAALEALSNLAPGDVVVTGGPGDAGGTTPYVLTFGGTLAQTDVAEVTTNPASLTGGAGTATVSTTTAGGGNGGSLTVTIQGKDAASGKYFTLLASAAITSVGTTRLVVYPGNTVAANLSVSTVLPATWRVDVVKSGNAPVASIGASLIR